MGEQNEFLMEKSHGKSFQILKSFVNSQMIVCRDYQVMQF